MKEKLSALIDGELDAHERHDVFDAVANDADLRKAWERYHIARAALRNELDIEHSPTLAGRIAASLEKEAVVIRPRFGGVSGYRRSTRLAGSLALAASVAAVAIFGLRTLQIDGISGSDAPPPLAQAPATTTTTSLGPNVPQQGTSDKNLNFYLVEHNEFSPSSSLKGMMTYGRLVSHENDR